MPKHKTFEQIIDKNIRKDMTLTVIGKVRLSGAVMWVGTANSATDQCLFITDDEVVREPLYLSSQEAKMLIEVLKTAIEENEE